MLLRSGGTVLTLFARAGTAPADPVLGHQPVYGPVEQLDHSRSLARQVRSRHADPQLLKTKFAASQLRRDLH